jgi:hypothetical protein
MFERICPRCFLPMNKDDVMNSLSHDNKIYICNQCGQIESMKGILGPDSVYGLELGQRRIQAALYGLNKNRDPNTPISKNPALKLEQGQQLWYDFKTKEVKIKDKDQKT